MHGANAEAPRRTQEGDEKGSTKKGNHLQTNPFPICSWPWLLVLSAPTVTLSPELAYPVLVVSVDMLDFFSYLDLMPPPAFMPPSRPWWRPRFPPPARSAPSSPSTSSSRWKGLLEPPPRLRMWEAHPLPPMVTSSVGPRLLVLLLLFVFCELPNWLETFFARGRSVGRHAQMTPHADSTTHHVHGVASVPGGFEVSGKVLSGKWTAVWIYCSGEAGRRGGPYMSCLARQKS